MKLHLLTLVVFIAFVSNAQKNKTENLIIVTLDGMRWQEVFGGIDSMIMYNAKYTQDTAEMKQKFWADDANERRKKLFPFLWSTVQQQGQLYGNRNIGNNVNNSNPFWFSYPGYNEIFTGYPDTSINSNDKIYNKNINVLEFINKQKSYAGKVAAFSTWDAFPYILNDKRSGLYVNSDVDSLKFKNASLQLLNDMQFLTPKPIGVRPDVITYFAAREYLKAYQPKVLYVAFDETDDYAHGGLYDQYIKSAHAEDAMIADLWKTVQSMPQYAGKTTLIVTCDHGRGDKIKDQWTSHGQKVEDSNQIWIAALGPDTPQTGEVQTKQQLYQRQLASTFASLLGFDFTTANSTMDPIKTIASK